MKDISNFALVDAVSKPNIMLQMCGGNLVAHKGAVDKLGDIQDALGGVRKQHKMVFVINQLMRKLDFKMIYQMFPNTNCLLTS